MRPSSLFILGMVFMGAFIGRAAVLAAGTTESAAGDHDQRAEHDAASRCVNGEFAEELKERMRDVEARSAKLLERESELSVFNDHIRQRLQDLEALKKEISMLIENIEGRRQEDIMKVATIYEEMKPQIAGGIIAGMDPEFAAGLFLAMKGENASAIMASMPPEKAYAVTVLMTNSIERR